MSFLEIMIARLFPSLADLEINYSNMLLGSFWSKKLVVEPYLIKLSVTLGELDRLLHWVELQHQNCPLFI
jgi:hypothetical protein